MLDLLASNMERTRIAEIYAHLLTRHDNDDPSRKMWSLYGLMRVAAIDPNCMQSQVVAALFVEFSKAYENALGFGLPVLVTRLWLGLFAAKFSSQEDAASLLAAVLQGPSRLVFEQEDPVYMMAMVVIIFGGTELDSPPRTTLINRLVQVLPHMDDLDLSNFLWHARYFSPCFEDGQCLARMIADPKLRARLIKIGPYRPSNGHFYSLLVGTDHGIAYFRRWLLHPLNQAALKLIDAAQSDHELIPAICYMYIQMHVPALLRGMPARQKLKSLLRGLVTDSRLYREMTFAGHPNRVWIAFAGQPPLSLDNFWHPHGLILALVLRLRIHHEGEAEPLEPEGDTNEVTYDLCTKVAHFFRINAPKDDILMMLGAVYPSAHGEDKLSRACGSF